MKLTNFIKLLATATVVSAAAGVAIGCQQEPVGPERLEGDIEIALQMEDLATKVDIADYSGVGSWTSGDKIAVYVTQGGVGQYKPFDVDVTGGTYHIDLNPGQNLAGYAISPSIMAAGTDSAPQVEYLTTYSMIDPATSSSRDLTSPTFSYVPMIAVNNDELLSFFHVGGLVRIALKNVPTGTNKIVVTFDGMTDVTGTCTIAQPGTIWSAATITSGTGNTVTFTNVNRSAADLFVNVPIPTGNYSALTSITVEAYQDATRKGIKRLNQRGRWSEVRHAHGRVITVDFDADLLSAVRLSATEAVTLWKSKTVQRTAVAIDEHGLEYPDATVVWTSSNNAVAKMSDVTPGLVEAVGAGTATIRATATPNTGGAAHYAEYTVHVNAITGIDVDNTISVDLYGTRTITATLTNSNNGTINGYPADMAVSWEIDDTGIATAASATTMPVRVDATTMTASVVINGAAEGNTTLDVSVPDYGSVTNSGKTIICEPPTSITGGTPYLFRGKYMYPGILKYESSAYGVTGELEGLASVMAAYGTAAGRDKHYFTWDALSTTFTTTAGVITGTVYDDGVNTWRIPTIAEWQTIIDGGPAASTYVNSTTTPLSKGVAEIVVNLTGSVLAGKGYTTSLMAAGNHTNYIGGVLLIPDGATIICARMRGTVGDEAAWSASSNCITYDDLETLVTGGCVFLPAAGYYNTSWQGAGYGGLYWSATETGTSAYDFFVRSERLNTEDIASKTIYAPVRLIRN